MTDGIKRTKRDAGGWTITMDGRRIGWVVRGSDGHWNAYLTNALAPENLRRPGQGHPIANDGSKLRYAIMDLVFAARTQITRRGL